MPEDFARFLVLLPRSFQKWVANHPGRAMGLIVALAVLLRLGAIYYAAPPSRVYGTEVANVAGAIASGRGIADVYGAGTGPTAHASPIYPILLAGVYLIFGFGQAGAIAQTAFAMLQVAGILFVMLALCRACGLPSISGLAGALFFSIPLWSFAERGNWEAPFSALTLLVAVIVAIRLCQRDTWSAREALTTGVFCGIALLITPPLFLWFVVLALGGMITRRARMLRFLSLAAVTAALVLLPWVIRNYRILGSPIWLRSNFGLEFRMAHNDQARTEFQDFYDSGVSTRMHPAGSEVERRRLSEIGEVAYNREKLREGLQWAYAHPRREAALLAGRIFHFWFPTLHRRLQTGLAWVFTLLGLASLVTWVRFSAASAFVTATLFLTYPLVYYVLSASNRYSYPLIPILMLFTGDFMRRLFARRTVQPQVMAARV